MEEDPFIQKIIVSRAWWFIGKILMRFSTSGALAAVKRRAVELVNREKSFLYFELSNARILSNVFQLFVPPFEATVPS
jgi:hypothetical protein